MAWVTKPDRRRVLAGHWWAGFPDQPPPDGHMALVFAKVDRGRSEVGSERGTAHHLPVGRFAVPDPDDDDRMTYWRVETTNASGSKKALRPWPAKVRWAPKRPPYPPGLDRDQRKEWTTEWYDSVYFGWKDDVIRAIAADPQGAADEFARSAPTADLPEPVKKRPRVRVRQPKSMSAKQRQVAAERLMAEALRRAGMSHKQVAGELGIPKTTVNRRLNAAGSIADGLAYVFIEARIAKLMTQVLAAVHSAGPEDLPRLQAQLEKIRDLQAAAAGVSFAAVEPAGPGAFGPSLAGDGW